MLISEELQQRADQLKAGHWVNGCPPKPGDECLVLKRNDSWTGTAMLTVAAGCFLEWYVYERLDVSHNWFYQLTEWNDSHSSVGPIIAELEQASICAKELGI